MTSKEITDALWRREEAGLAALMEQYGPLCRKIAGNILPAADAEEVVSDVWFRVWNTVPPHRPVSLAAYVCRITRNLAINRYHRSRAACRTPDALVDWAELTENPDLFEVVSAADPTAETAEAAELARAIDRFLRNLEPEDRVLFLRRYVYLDDTDTLAKAVGIRSGTVRVRLHRLRKRLRKYLEEEKLL